MVIFTEHPLAVANCIHGCKLVVPPNTDKFLVDMRQEIIDLSIPGTFLETIHAIDHVGKILHALELKRIGKAMELVNKGTELLEENYELQADRR